MNIEFSLEINSIDENCFEYEVSFLDKTYHRCKEAGTAPSIEMCFDSAMNYYGEVMHGYIEDDDEDTFCSICDDEDFD